MHIDNRPHTREGSEKETERGEERDGEWPNRGNALKRLAKRRAAQSIGQFHTTNKRHYTGTHTHHPTSTHTHTHTHPHKRAHAPRLSFLLLFKNLNLFTPLLVATCEWKRIFCLFALVCVCLCMRACVFVLWCVSAYFGFCNMLSWCAFYAHEFSITG